jgi:hypothetical protein
MKIRCHTGILHGGPMARLSGAALLLPLLLAAPARAADLDQAVALTTRQLSQVWKADPLTAALPMPAVELLPAGRSPAQACPAAAGPTAQATARYCASTGVVLLDRAALQDAHDIHPQGGAAFWIARGLAQAIPSQQGGTAPLPPVAANLQATCLAGTLLGAIPSPDAALQRSILEQAVKMARVAYAPTEFTLQGSPGQRAYALLTGTGGTPLTCSAASITQLALSPDTLPALDGKKIFEILTTNRDPNVGIEVFCRKPPHPSCPLRLGVSSGVTGI